MNENANMKKNSSGLKEFFTSTAGVVLIVTIVLAVAVHIITGGNFFTPYNLATYTRTASFTIIVGAAQTLVLLLGGIDLSVASIAGFSSMVFAMLVLKAGMNPILAIVIAIACGLVWGAVNGLFICGLELPPFIVTLATSQIIRGIIYVATKGFPLTGIPAWITVVGQGSLGGLVPYPTIIMVILIIILAFMLKNSSFGRHIYAVGGNESAARIVGIRTNRTKTWVYALSGVISGLAGVLMVLRMGASQVNIGETWVMPSITAAVLGGTSMAGGVGGVGGTLIGGLLMGAISFSINLLGIDSYWDNVVTGLVVLAAVSLDAITKKRRAS